MEIRPGANIRTRETYDLAVPKEINRRLLLLGGVNPYGQPMYRCVWGWSRRCVVHVPFNEWLQQPSREHDEDGVVHFNKGVLLRRRVEVRRIPKYQPASYFYVERWVPAWKFGTPEDFKDEFTKILDGERTMPIGEYPSTGEYEALCRISKKVCKCKEACPHPRAFVYPTVEEMDAIVYGNRAAMEQSAAQRKAEDKAALERQKQQQETIIDDVTRDGFRPIHFNPHVSLVGLDVPKRGTDA